MEKIIDRIKKSKNFVVTSHVNPDGDNVGSSVAMTKYLRRIGKNAIHILEDDIPENLIFLLTNYEILRNKDSVKEYFGDEKYDLIVLDSAEKNRVAIDPKIIENAECVLNIDHHMSNTGFGDLDHIVPSIGSSCEVLSNVIRNIDEDAIDEEIATALYTGISTDTGNFMFPSVTEDTFYTAAFLTKKGADRDRIANEVYRNNSLELRMLTKMVLETFRLQQEVGIIYMTMKMLEDSGMDYKDTEPIANIPIDTKGVKVGIFIKEKEPAVFKISLRSKDRINVCEIAQKFNGGGHFNASGCTIFGDLDDAITKLQRAAEEQIQKDA